MDRKKEDVVHLVLSVASGIAALFVGAVWGIATMVCAGLVFVYAKNKSRRAASARGTVPVRLQARIPRDRVQGALARQLIRMIQTDDGVET